MGGGRSQSGGRIGPLPFGVPSPSLNGMTLRVRTSARGRATIGWRISARCEGHAPHREGHRRRHEAQTTKRLPAARKLRNELQQHENYETNSSSRSFGVDRRPAGVYARLGRGPSGAPTGCQVGRRCGAVSRWSCGPTAASRRGGLVRGRAGCRRRPPGSAARLLRSGRRGADARP